MKTKHLKQIIWFIGACLVLWLIIREPQWALQAAESVNLLTGGATCNCTR